MELCKFRHSFSTLLRFWRCYSLTDYYTNKSNMSNNSTSKQSSNKITAGIIIIGDEILKGYTEDTNSRYLCRALFKQGIKVSKISVIPDCVDTIATEIKEFSDKYTFVITSGGVGPTHDDMTFEGLAKAFNDHIVLNEQLVAVLKKFFGDNKEKTAAYKLAQIPSTSELLWGIHKKTHKPSLYPVVRVKNVTVFPGIPKLLQKAFDMLEDQFTSPNGQFLSKAVYVNTDEFTIADCLTLLSKNYENSVNVGSYPVLHHSYYKVKVTLDSTNDDSITNANKELLDNLPKGSVVQFDDNPTDNAYQKLETYLEQLQKSDKEFYDTIKESLEIIENALNEYDWLEFCLAFNGGKDCTALLHLLHCAIVKKYGQENERKIKSIYIQQKNPFEEMESFIESSRNKYNLNLSAIKGDMKEACTQLKLAHPEIKAVFMGTRACDPYAHQLTAVEKTDAGWPEFYRVSPLIKWNYHQVWKFLRDLWLPYCTLYDHGYTSLGDKHNTERNPALEFTDTFGRTRHKPAYLLEDGNLERNGRKKNCTVK